MRIRQLLLCGAVAFTGLSALAVPARRGLRTFSQPDGTTISLNLVGDEFSHSYVTPDGLAVARGADGSFHYLTADGISDVAAHDIADRTPSEAAFILSNSDDLQARGVMSARAKARDARKAPRRRAPQKASQVPSSGSPRVPILLVQYKDYKFKDRNPAETFNDFFQSGEKSAHKYFTDQSNGKYTPQFDVYGPYTLSGNRAVYGGNDYYGDDKGVGKMVGEGCLGLDPQIDFSKYDNDGDGECDVVIVLYAGDGEASSYDEDCEDAVWPCQWDLASSDYGKDLTLDRTKVSKFAVFNELNGLDLSKIDGIGTFCHEFSHCLDLPDFYDTEYGPHFGMSNWSLMDYGSYNDDGYTPIGYSAYEKAFMGWIEIEEADENTLYNLPVFNAGSESTDRAVKITNDKDPDEYYIIENRRRQGWDAYMPAEGLMISHVTYDAAAWRENTVNNYDMQRMTIIPADGELKLDKETYNGETSYIPNEADLKGDLWPYNGADELTDTSRPAAKVNTGSYMGKPVTEMTRNPDGTISFWAMKAPLPAVAAPARLTYNVDSADTATFSWTAGDSNDVTYTLEVKEHKDIEYSLLASVDFTSEPDDWTTEEGYVEYTATDGVRLGSSKKGGAILSPAYTAGDDGQVTVLFNAKAWSSSEGSSAKVSILDASGTTLSTGTVALTGAASDYSLLLHATPDESFKVRFETVGNKKRYYIASADIYAGDATALRQSARKAAESGDATSRTVTGITGTTYTVSGLTGGVTYDCRVKAVPVDAESFAQSAWSETVEMPLGDATTVETVDYGDAPAVYYTLQGVCLGAEAPGSAGIYIRRAGSRVSKIIIR